MSRRRMQGLRPAQG